MVQLCVMSRCGSALRCVCESARRRQPTQRVCVMDVFVCIRLVRSEPIAPLLPNQKPRKRMHALRNRMHAPRALSIPLNILNIGWQKPDECVHSPLSLAGGSTMPSRIWGNTMPFCCPTTTPQVVAEYKHPIPNPDKATPVSLLTPAG